MGVNDLHVAREKHALPEAASSEASIPELTTETNKKSGATKLKLPIDEFQETILQRIQDNRITIIQGDTGCGKSSRIPVMLLNAPSPNPMQTQTKLFISQPRRIAAKALVERLRTVEPELKDQIALRMGHGVREYENKRTRAWFVTTGYLVRMLANNPTRFDDISALIIDEVHERSVDTDILCLLCRRLLQRNEHIRLVLMSATLAANMYQEYFGVPEPPIRVGGRRFPVKEVFLDDLKEEVKLSATNTRKVKELLDECLKMKCIKPPSKQYMEKAYSVVANLATIIGKAGTSVLIFVPGMNEIAAITELIEAITVPGIRFTCVPIHSDIPFEDQMLAFDASEEDEVKIVIATNAAESSLTLPDVNNVICLGLCKQIVYNQASHRQMLTPTWISKASATQRAGRTGRVRPGTVYRIYARQSYELHMEPFEPGEILRIPLDSVILMLKEILPEEQISEVLLTCLEPPDISAIGRSFESLHKSHFISAADDSCELTKLGAFVSSLGIDLALGSLIGLGIQMGLGAEAIQMAAILSFPKSPWVMSNPLVHPTASFNKNTCRSYVSRCHFDANLFSEPLAIMNLLWEYENLEKKHVEKWNRFHNTFLPRIRQLLLTTTNLRKRVAGFLGIFEGLLKVAKPPSQMPHGMITLLRVIQVWVFHETLIQFDYKTLQKLQKKHSQTGVSLDVQPKSDVIEQSHIEQILISDRHPFRLKSTGEICQKGDFKYTPSGTQHSAGFNSRLKMRLISYASEKNFQFVCVSFRDSLMVFTFRQSTAEDAVINCIKGHRKEDNRVLVNAVSIEGKSSRGIGGRACGLWAVEQSSKEGKSNAKSKSWLLMYFSNRTNQKTNKTKSKKNEKKKLNSGKDELKTVTNSIEKLGRTGDHKGIVLHFPWSSDSIGPNKRFKFSLISFGTTHPVNLVDMKDLFGSYFESTTKEIPGKQKVQFPICSSEPREYNKGKDRALVKNLSSWDRPLINCIPEGARVFSVLVSKRRRENVIKFVATEVEEKDDENEDTDLNIYWDRNTNASFRWKRFNSNDAVFIDVDSVPATAVPMDSSDDLYCVCANTLEVRGGGLRAEGLTLLPQGKAFLLLARFTFGLFEQTDFEDGTIKEIAINWIGTQLGRTQLKGLTKRIKKAVDFHHSALDLGESLECFPQKIAELLDIFDDVDGYEASVWESLSSNPLIRHNMGKHQLELKGGKRTTRRNISATTSERKNTNSKMKEMTLQPDPSSANQINGDKNNVAKGKLVPENFSLISLPQTEQRELCNLFQGKPKKHSIGSCEKLAQGVYGYIVGKSDQTVEKALGGPDWEFYLVQLEGKDWFKAVFKPKDVSYTDPRNKKPAWMTKKAHWDARPPTVQDAMSCIPPKYQGKRVKKESLRIAPGTKYIIFHNLKLAVQMEAAFWMERQFGSKKGHWFEHKVPQLIEQMKHLRKPTKKTKNRKRIQGIPKAQSKPPRTQTESIAKKRT